MEKGNGKMRFKEYYLGEAIAIEDVSTKKGKKEAVFTIGRYNFFTGGHYSIITQLKKSNKPIILVLVKGKGTSKDKDKNPLNVKDQLKIIKKSAGKEIQDIIVIDNGFMGEAINAIRKKNYEPVELWTGTDRLKTYTDQVKKYKDTWDLNLKVKEIKRTGKSISATKARASVRNDDFKTFKELTHNLDKKDFEFLKSKMK